VALRWYSDDKMIAVELVVCWMDCGDDRIKLLTGDKKLTQK
jgi:hypothetical protein